MRTTLVMPYADIVRNLFKKDTLQRMYMHAGVGIVGEIIEYQEAQLKGLGKCVTQGEHFHDIIEELGDLCFYLQAALMLAEMPNIETFQDLPKELDWHLLFNAGEVMDCGKRFDTYGKPLEQERWNRNLTATVACFYSQLRVHGLSLLHVQLANQNKLLTGEKARYALGIYTDEQAQARADKAVPAGNVSGGNVA